MDLRTVQFIDTGDELNWIMPSDFRQLSIQFTLARTIWDSSINESSTVPVHRLVDALLTLSPHSPDPDLGALELLHAVDDVTISRVVCCPRLGCHSLLPANRLGKLCEQCFAELRQEAAGLATEIAA